MLRPAPPRRSAATDGEDLDSNEATRVILGSDPSGDAVTANSSVQRVGVADTEGNDPSGDAVTANSSVQRVGVADTEGNRVSYGCY